MTENEQDAAFAGYDRAHEIISEYEDFGLAFDLIQFALEQGADVPNDGKFANATAALAAFTRAYHDLQAGLHLCQFHFYTQAVGIARSVYEAAGIGRTMAKSHKVADQWVQGSWQPDMKARQFVRNVMYGDAAPEERDEAVEPYTKSYEMLSAWAHITPASALEPYVRDSENGYALQLEPEFDEEKLRFALTALIKQAVFLVYAIRNSASRLEVYPVKWLTDLDELGKRVVGPYAQALEIDYEEFDRRRQNIVDNLRSTSEHKRTMKRDSNSVDNLLRDRSQGQQEN